MEKIIKITYMYILALVLMVLLCGCESSNAQNEENAKDNQDEISSEVVDEITEGESESENSNPAETDSDFLAFDQWIDAENAISERYMYEAMIEGFLVADDEIAHGWLDEGTKNFIRLIKGDTIAETATAMEMVTAYRTVDDVIENTSYSIRDFFTVDEYGYSTSLGIYNFLVAIDQLESSKFGGVDVVNARDNNVFGWDFDVVGGDATIADALGVSEEFVLIFQHAAIDAGFSVTFED